jgi:hypothetical protein
VDIRKTQTLAVWVILTIRKQNLLSTNALDLYTDKCHLGNTNFHNQPSFYKSVTSKFMWLLCKTIWQSESDFVNVAINCPSPNLFWDKLVQMRKDKYKNACGSIIYLKKMARNHINGEG